MVSLFDQPLIGFEPMTYALPWRYSTTELKGPRFIYLPSSIFFNLNSHIFLVLVSILLVSIVFPDERNF